MSTQNILQKFVLLNAAGVLAVALAYAAPAQADAGTTAAATEPRVSVSRQIKRGGRDGQAGDRVRHELGALQSTGKREQPAASKLGESSTATARAVNEDFWFYDADVILFNDNDNDGYYHGIDLLIDVDTYYDAVDVYAVTYLSFEGGPWNEYSATDDFTIFGASSEDEYVIVTELESGYPTGSYDLLIELYDAVDGTFLAEFGPADTSALAFLPLEDAKRDAPYVEEVIVVGRGGGNGFGLLLLAVPLLARAIRRRLATARA
jgi:hypothetical protein